MELRQHPEIHVEESLNDNIYCDEFSDGRLLFWELDFHCRGVIMGC